MERREFLAGISGTIAGSQVKAEAVSCENPVFIDVTVSTKNRQWDPNLLPEISEQIKESMERTKYKDIPVFVHTDDVTMDIKEIPKP